MSFEPRTFNALYDALDEDLSSTPSRETVVRAVLTAIVRGRVPGLTTCDLPELLPVGQVREDDLTGNQWIRTASTDPRPWNGTQGGRASDEEAMDWKVVWTPGDEVVRPGHVQIDASMVKDEVLNSWLRGTVAGSTADAVLSQVARAETHRRGLPF